MTHQPTSSKPDPRTDLKDAGRPQRPPHPPRPRAHPLLTTDLKDAGRTFDETAARVTPRASPLPPMTPQPACPTTLADLGRVRCSSDVPHNSHRGCVFELPDQADAVHHDHQLDQA
jgi:hypothetical protein